MAKIPDVHAAKKLRDQLFPESTWPRVREARAIRDRQTTDQMNALKKALPANVQAAFLPFMGNETNEEIRDAKHILVSNPYELEVISKSSDQPIINKAQDLEGADEALLDHLFPPDIQLDECDALLGDALAVIALEYDDESPQLAQFAERDKLKTYAEAADDDDAPAEETTARARYKAAYRKAGDHEKAYRQVTDDAKAMDGPHWYARVVDLLTFKPFIHRGRVVLGVEHGEVPLNPVLKALEGHVIKRGKRFYKLDADGKPTGMPPFGDTVSPADGDSTLADFGGGDSVKYTQIRTLEETVIFIEHLDGGTDTDPGVMISFDNLFGGAATGYYIVAGDHKTRGNLDDSYDPPMLGMMVMEQMHNVAMTVVGTMALAEATRDIYQAGTSPAVRPLDTTQRQKAGVVKDGVVPAALAGEVKRVETTGVDLGGYLEHLQTITERYRNREFFSGTGASGESGIALARVQTAFLTKLAPYQTKRAAVRKQILLDIHRAVVVSGKPCHIPWQYNDQRPAGESVRVAKPRCITPEMAQLPVDIRITIGAESPETKYAREQASREEVGFGSRDMITHMEITGVKDPQDMLMRIAKGNMVFGALGTGEQPGWMVTMAQEMLRLRAKEYLDAQMPPPLAPPAPLEPPMDPMAVDEFGQPIGAMPPTPQMDAGAVAGPVRFNPPVQNIGGNPITAGAQPGVV